jgi:hypothetical protein
MTLEYRDRSPASGGRRPVLVECPACGEAIAETAKTSSHIRQHDPADFGLGVGSDGGMR